VKPCEKTPQVSADGGGGEAKVIYSALRRPSVRKRWKWAITGLILMLIEAGLAPAVAADRPGQYDYLLMSLSWAPSFCATDAGRRAPQQCGMGRSYGMVVHGLWPSDFDGGWPEQCQAVRPLTPSPALTAVAQVMIGESLQQHEWRTHGACLAPGITQDPFLQSILVVVQRYGLAPTLRPEQHSITAAALRQLWPSVPAEAIHPVCGRHGMLREVRLCLDRALNPLACPEAERRDRSCPDLIRLQ